jgi:hypothetical protein
MKKNKLAFKLIDMGLKAETLANLTESQLRLLYNKLNEQPTPAGNVTKQTKTVTTYSVPQNSETELPTGGKNVVVSTKGGKTSITPMESEMKEGKKKKSKKYNPWAICTASVGRKDKKKYERCVMDVKKSIKEGKDPVNLFLEEKIVSLLERHIQPKITKREFLQMILETQTKEKEKTKEKDVPTKPGKPGKSTPYRPKHKDAPAAVNEFLDTETAPTKPKERETIKPGKPDKSTPYRPKHRPAPQASNNKIQNLFPWDEVSKIARNKGLGFITQYIK